MCYIPSSVERFALSTVTEWLLRASLDDVRTLAAKLRLENPSLGSRLTMAVVLRGVADALIKDDPTE